MDSVVVPIPGMLAGGPHDGGQDEFNPEKPNETWKCPTYRKVGTAAAMQPMKSQSIGMRPSPMWHGP